MSFVGRIASPSQSSRSAAPFRAQTLRVAMDACVHVERFPPGRFVARAVIALGLHSVGQVTRPFRILEAPQEKRQRLVN